MHDQLETQIAEWRSYIDKGPAVDGRDVEELESHLRDQIADLTAIGLDDDEAFMVAVKRLGAVDELSFEFARENGGLLWKQLALAGEIDRDEADRGWVEALVFAFAAAVIVQLMRYAAGFPNEMEPWFVLNLSLFVAPFLAAYFARRRNLPMRDWLIMTIPFVAAALVANLYPFIADGSSELLVAAHLPVVLWFVIAYPYSGGDLSSHERRMDFVRFTGEWFIYYVLIALGGVVLLTLTGLILEPISTDTERIIDWVIAPGAAGAVIIAAWLVESKQHVVENMAPVLTMIFTPLFALMLVAAVVTYAVTGLGQNFDRELLGVFDALLVVVLGLVLYGISARDPARPPGWMDRIQLLAVAAALILDGMGLYVMSGRVGDLGFTPNRVATLGLNLVLLVSLAGTAWLSFRFITGRGTLHRLERWQTSYLPVFAIWAAAVVVVLPPLFDFA